MAPATPPSTGLTMDSVGADDGEVVVGGDAEPAVENVSEPVVAGPVVAGPVVGGAVVGGAVVGGAVVGGAVVGGAVVGGTLGLGVGVMLTSDVVGGPMDVLSLPLPLPDIKVLLGKLLSDWPGEERRENMRLTMFERIWYVDTANL